VNDSDWENCVTGDNGEMLTSGEVRAEFERLLSSGLRKQAIPAVPMGDCGKKASVWIVLRDIISNLLDQNDVLLRKIDSLERRMTDGDE